MKTSLFCTFKIDGGEYMMFLYDGLVLVDDTPVVNNGKLLMV